MNLGDDRTVMRSVVVLAVGIYVIIDETDVIDRGRVELPFTLGDPRRDGMMS